MRHKVKVQACNTRLIDTDYKKSDLNIANSLNVNRGIRIYNKEKKPV